MKIETIQKASKLLEKLNEEERKLKELLSMRGRAKINANPLHIVIITPDSDRVLTGIGLTEVEVQLIVDQREANVERIEKDIEDLTDE